MGRQPRTTSSSRLFTFKTSYNQQFTIIHIQDEQLRQEIAAVTGQAHVAGTKGELFIFVIDLYRNACIRQAADADLVHASRMNAYMAGHNDAAIGAQNMVIAAESLGLGTVYLGSINADPRRMIELLGLPAYTYPAFGLLVGHPASEPERKPRLPLSVTVAVDRYPSRRLGCTRPLHSSGTGGGARGLAWGYDLHCPAHFGFY